MVLALRRDLTRNLGRTQKASFDTIRAHVDQLMGVLDKNRDDGDNGTYTQLNLFDTIGSIVTAISNKMLVGDELFRNKAFMQSLNSFGNTMGLASLLIGQLLPFFLRPVVGLIAGWAVEMYRRRTSKFLVPVAQRRIDEIRRKKEDPGREYEAPLDIMQWIIVVCPDASADDISDIILSLVSSFLLRLSYLGYFERGKFFLFHFIFSLLF